MPPGYEDGIVVKTMEEHLKEAADKVNTDAKCCVCGMVGAWKNEVVDPYSGRHTEAKACDKCFKARFTNCDCCKKSVDITSTMQERVYTSSTKYDTIQKCAECNGSHHYCHIHRGFVKTTPYKQSFRYSAFRTRTGAPIGGTCCHECCKTEMFSCPSCGEHFPKTTANKAVHPETGEEVNVDLCSACFGAAQVAFELKSGKISTAEGFIVSGGSGARNKIYNTPKPDRTLGHVCCKSPAEKFWIPSPIVEGGIKNDVRYPIQSAFSTRLPTEAINTICTFVQDKFGVNLKEEAFDWTIETKDGSLAKRIKSLLYKKHKVKATPEDVSHIGNVAAKNSGDGKDATIVFTRQLNQEPGVFMNKASCWWQGYKVSRCIFKSMGGIGVLIYRGKTGGACARAWLLPLVLSESTKFRAETTTVYNIVNSKMETGMRVRAGENKKYLVPTTLTNTGCWAIFNTYGDKSIDDFRKILQPMLGTTCFLQKPLTGMQGVATNIHINNGRGIIMLNSDPDKNLNMDIEKFIDDTGTIELPYTYVCAGTCTY